MKAAVLLCLFAGIGATFVACRAAKPADSAELSLRVAGFIKSAGIT